MKALPDDVVALNARVIAGVCADILDSARGRRAGRVEAIREIRRQEQSARG